MENNEEIEENGTIEENAIDRTNSVPELSMIRGDTATFKFQRKNAEGDPILVKAEKMYFTIKKSNINSQPVLQKTIDDMIFDNEGYYHFTIYPDETNNLEYFTYFYDVERIQNDNKKTISYGNFTIKPEITFARNEV